MKIHKKYLYIISSSIFQLFFGIVIGNEKIRIEKIIGIYIVYIIFAILTGMYQDMFGYFWNVIRKRIKVMVELEVIVCLLSFWYSKFNFSFFVVGTMINICFFIIEVIRLILEEKYSKKKFLILGSNEEIDKFINMFRLNKNIIIKKFVIGEDKIVFLNEKRKIEKIISSSRIQNIIIISDNGSIIKKYIEYLKNQVDNIYILPSYYGKFSWNLKLDYADRFIIFKYFNYSDNKVQVISKRITDILLAMVGMLLFIIVYVLYALKMRKDGGSVLFFQKRMGQFLKEFKMYKFRTMKVNAEFLLEEMLRTNDEIKKEYYATFKIKDDPRITNVGKFLRKTSLDEVPQFINVLVGNMSLVGPRPVIEDEIRLHYSNEIGRKVFEFKPGVTGVWQVYARSDIQNYSERIAMDLYYVENWSFWLDVIIVFKTLKNVIKRRGAY